MTETINKQAVFDLLATFRYEIEMATKQGCAKPVRGVGDPSRKRAAKSLKRLLAIMGVEAEPIELERLVGLHDD